ncbi:MAG: DUF1844 domain-containing protein [Candidatus Omnitrophica bacterium]|nr:DUF1844 domain-containing protein [Candidatus Omnitrophota bacterium]
MDKDIRFSEKRVDENFKEQAAREKGTPTAQPRRPSEPSSDARPNASSQKTSKNFLNFVTSLGYQALIHLGDMPNPETNEREPNLQAAREIIDLLAEIKIKTEGNLSPEEARFFDSVLPELQLKFSQLV